jgi:hypothetical protein
MGLINASPPTVRQPHIAAQRTSVSSCHAPRWKYGKVTLVCHDPAAVRLDMPRSQSTI